MRVDKRWVSLEKRKQFQWQIVQTPNPATPTIVLIAIIQLVDDRIHWIAGGIPRSGVRSRSASIGFSEIDRSLP
jgi:hypothetical protein